MISSSKREKKKENDFAMPATEINVKTLNPINSTQIESIQFNSN